MDTISQFQSIIMGWITVPEGIASVMFIHSLPPQDEGSNQKPYDIDVAEQEQCMDTTVPFDNALLLRKLATPTWMSKLHVADIESSTFLEEDNDQ